MVDKLWRLYWDLPKEPAVQWVAVTLTGLACAVALAFILGIVQPRAALACDPQYQTCVPGAKVERAYCDDHPYFCGVVAFFRWIQEL